MTIPLEQDGDRLKSLKLFIARQRERLRRNGLTKRGREVIQTRIREAKEEISPLADVKKRKILARMGA